MKFNKFSVLLVASILMIGSCGYNKTTQMLKQSPIALQLSNVIDSKNGEYLDSQFGIINSVNDTGHDILVSIEGTTKINGNSYEAIQMHFHNNSEHTLNGKYYPLEGHIVHININDESELLVVGVFYDLGEKNPAFDFILNNFMTGKTMNVADKKIGIGSLLPKDKSYLAYSGSLTTPPYSENVSWYVMTEPVKISAEQMERHNSFYSNNYRELQNINGRVINHVH
ncbi:MAG: carbonic anhydrase family protein [Brevinema sp.]